MAVLFFASRDQRQKSAAGKVLATILVAGAVLAAAAFTPLGVVEAAPVHFTDVAGHWAENEVVEMSAYGIVKGYPDGTFRPNKDVTLLESLVMIINTCGLAEEAGKIDPDKTGLKFPPGMKWGKNYLAVAVENGILAREGLPYFKYNDPAVRWEVATMLCLALGLQPDYSTLGFSDFSVIPEGYRPYVTAVVKKGIMTGMPGNTFGPNVKVNRAQMCAMLRRVIDGGMASPYPEHKLTGKFESLDEGNGILAIRDIYGEKKLKLASGCVLRPGAAGAFVRGERVRAVLDRKGEVVLLKRFPGQQGSTARVRGTLIGLDSSSGVCKLKVKTESGAVKTYTLAGDADIYRQGRIVTVAALVEGLYLELEADGSGTVWKVTVYDGVPAESGGVVEGTVEDISARYLILSGSGAHDIAVDARFFRRGDEINYFDVIPGARVRAELEGGLVKRVEVLNDTDITVQGRVTNINENYRRLTLEINGVKFSFDVSSGVNIIIDSGVNGISRWQDLAGCKVEAELRDGRIVEVTVLSC